MNEFEEDRWIKVRASEWQDGADKIKELESKIAHLRKGLREIAWMNCVDTNLVTNDAYVNGHAKGHRCAAAVARKYLEEE